MEDDRVAVRAHDENKKIVFDKAREFFANCSDLVEHLTLILGREEFLQEQATNIDGFVTGTRSRLPPRIKSRVTKKDVLRDDDRIFDAIRWDFMVGRDPVQSTKTFYDRLSDLQPFFPAEGISDIAAFMAALKSCEHSQSAASRERLHDLVPELWEFYVEALSDEEYYLSTHEVLMLCILSRQSVAIFSNDNGVLEEAGKCVFPGSSIVSIKVDRNHRRRRIRSHFERIQWQGHDSGGYTSDAPFNLQQARE